MNVSELMTQRPRTCRPDESMERACQIFWDQDCGYVPVTDSSNHVVGVLTDRDACMAAYIQGKRLAEIPVSSAMTKNVHVCRETDTISTAEMVMRANRIRRVPVVNDNRKLVGVLSLNDIAREATRERSHKQRVVTQTEVAETLSSVCSPRSHDLAMAVA